MSSISEYVQKVADSSIHLKLDYYPHKYVKRVEKDSDITRKAPTRLPLVFPYKTLCKVPLKASKI